METKAFVVTNIDWDCDDEPYKDYFLPTEWVIYGESEDEIAETLFDEFGYRVNGFNIED